MGANKWAVGDYVKGTFVVANIEQKQGTRGGPFLAGKLQNKHGVIPFKRWNATLSEGIGKGNVIEVSASVDAYEGVTQLIIQGWDVALDTSYDKPQWIDPPPIERTLQRELFTPARKDVFRREREAKAAEREARRKGLIL